MWIRDRAFIQCVVTFHEEVQLRRWECTGALRTHNLRRQQETEHEFVLLEERLRNVTIHDFCEHRDQRAYTIVDVRVHRRVGERLLEEQHECLQTVLVQLIDLRESAHRKVANAPAQRDRAVHQTNLLDLLCGGRKLLHELLDACSVRLRCL